MKKKNKTKQKYAWRLVLATLAIFAALVAIFVTVAIVAPPKRSTKAIRYDLNCVAGRSKNPLMDCKED
jgi:hypothetical protein